MAVTNVTDMLSDITAQTLQPTIDRIMIEVSNLLGYMTKSSKGVWQNPDIGRDWKVTRSFEVGLGGSIEPAGIDGPSVYDTSDPGLFNVYNQVETWPGLGESTSPAYITREIALKRQKINMHIPHLVLKLAGLRAHIGQHMEATIRATAKQVAHFRANAFISAGSRSQIGEFKSGGADTISPSGLQVTLADGFPANRFANGQRVDIFPQDDDTRVNSEPVFIGRIDPFGTSASPIENSGGTMYLYTVSGSYDLGAATDYDIVPRNSGRELLAGAGSASARMPATLLSHFIDTGTIHGIDVTKLTELKSMVRDLSGAVLTGNRLLKLLGHYLQARPGMNGVDGLWAQIGVWNAYFNTLGAEFTIERGGQVVEVNDGFAKNAGYSIGGMKIPFMTDSWLPEGKVVGMKTRNNWTLLTPPRYKGSSSQAMFDGGVEFLWPMFGGKGIFAPYRKTGGPDAGAFTDFVEAPGEIWYEIVPEKIGGILLEDCASLYG
jgi:hypothetical protein